MTANFSHFADIIARHSGTSFLCDPSVRRQLTLSQDRLRSGKLLESVYAPFDHIETGASLVIVGITPGDFQAEVSLVAARAALQSGLSVPEATRVAKTAASFSGKLMRGNLIGMLDAIGVPEWLGIDGSASIFGKASHRVHLTSALRNPVFVGGRNYNGTPNILKTPMLKAIVDDTLASEVRELPNAYWLPLWDEPASALQHLVARGILRADRVLPPLPHPSGGNNENVSWILGTNRKTTFSSRRASTGPLLLDRRRRLNEFFRSPRLQTA